MADIEVVDLCNEDDEVQVAKPLRKRPEPNSPPPVKRASLPRRCKSQALNILCPSKAPTNSSSTAPVTKKRAVKGRPRKKAVLSPVKEPEFVLAQPYQVQSTSNSPVSSATAKNTGKEQKKLSSDLDLDFIPLSAGSEKAEHEKQASVLDLDFIPLSEDLDAPESEENKKSSEVLPTDKGCTIPVGQKGDMLDSQEASCSNRGNISPRSEGNSDVGENSAARARKRKERRSLQELQVLDLSFIPLLGDPVTMSTPKPSLRHVIKAKRRRKSMKKRESVVLLNRGLPLNEEIVLDDAEDENVPAAQNQESAPSPKKKRLSPSPINNAENAAKASTSEAIAPNLPIADEQKEDETLEDGEIVDEDEIQIIGDKSGSNSGNPTSRSSSPEITELPQSESAKKKPQKKNKKNNSPLKKRESLEEISLLHDWSLNMSANTSGSRKGKKKRKKGKAAEISTQTTPSLARLAALNNNSQPTGSSPSVKRPSHFPSQAASWNPFQPIPHHMPNLPFVPTVHMVPQTFNFGQIGNPQPQKPGLLGPMPTLHNPDRGNLPQVGLRPIVIDGCNVAMHHGKNSFFSVRGIQLCVDYFLKLGHRVFAFVPEHCYGRKPDDPELLTRLERLGHVIKTPGRIVRGRIVTSYDDKYIVSYATEVGGVVVSRDRYRDLIEERWDWRITIEKRLLQPTFVGNMVMFPDDPLGRYGPRLPQFLSF